MLASAPTLLALRFEAVRQAIVERARTESGKVRAAARPFLETREAVEAALALVEEARTLHAEPLMLPLAGLPDVRPLAARAARGGMLDPQELLQVTAALFAFDHTAAALEARAERLPRLAEIARAIPDTGKLPSRLERSIEPSGAISDSASPGLKAARDRTRGLHRTIKARLDDLLHDEAFKANLQEQYYSVRHERYVVPVLSQHQRLVPGIVHNASQTGQTLFVEPEALIGLGNELAIAQSVVLEEERQVLLELSELVGDQAEGIERGIAACAELDEAEAAAALSDALKARRPELEPEDGQLALIRLRHPLLALGGADVVPNDVELRGPARSLVISGPNAGGKTITLTAVGLVALMVRAGLPVPVGDGSRLPLFKTVDSAVGDSQDLSRGLSTFSAHVTQLRDICASAGSGALVLIDEIAADTDPKEGAAIATAVLETLLSQGAVALVTTHLEELKALAHLDPRFVNARVGFDAARMAPTYRLQLGAAGSSSAIDVARRVGLPEAICVRATELAKNAGGALAQALVAAN
ncbi:MAG: endonuclease MutS2, partial [Myxococcaceae bacterium]|nr:endonuclease MutS2 [Myxococcaceae bacterium]